MGLARHHATACACTNDRFPFQGFVNCPAITRTRTRQSCKRKSAVQTLSHVRELRLRTTCLLSRASSPCILYSDSLSSIPCHTAPEATARHPLPSPAMGSESEYKPSITSARSPPTGPAQPASYPAVAPSHQPPCTSPLYRTVPQRTPPKPTPTITIITTTTTTIIGRAKDLSWPVSKTTSSNL